MRGGAGNLKPKKWQLYYLVIRGCIQFAMVDRCRTVWKSWGCSFESWAVVVEVGVVDTSTTPKVYKVPPLATSELTSPLITRVTFISKSKSNDTIFRKKNILSMTIYLINREFPPQVSARAITVVTRISRFCPPRPPHAPRPLRWKSRAARAGAAGYGQVPRQLRASRWPVA